MPPRPAVDVVDSTWLNARPAAAGGPLGEAANWRRWWPGLVLRVGERRGAKGMRWFVDAVSDEPAAGLSGSAEVWLQAVDDGTVAHFFLRLDPRPGATLTPRQREQLVDRFRRQAKRGLWSLGDQLDPGRRTRHTSASHASVT